MYMVVNMVRRKKTELEKDIDDLERGNYGRMLKRKASHIGRSHGRRHASAKTIARKQAKAQIRKANTQLRKLKKDKIGKYSPAITHKTNKGNPFKLSKGASMNEIRRVSAEAQQFTKATTSTPKGAKKVLNQTLRNIIAGHGGVSEEEVKKYNFPKLIYDDSERGVHFVKTYFDVYYKAKDYMTTSHIYVSSDDLLEAIHAQLDDALSIDVETSEDSDGSATVTAYLDVLTNDEFIQGVEDRLKG